MDETNYKKHRNIHPVNPKAWKRLGFLAAKDVAGFIDAYLKKYKLKLSWWQFRKFKKEERKIEKKRNGAM